MRNKTFLYKHQDEKSFFNMLIDLMSSQKGKEFDAIQAARYARKHWGIDEDWHVFSFVLDQLHTNGLATIVKPGGYVVYRIEGES